MGPSSKDKHEAATPSSSSYSGTPDETPDETTPTPSSSNHKDEVDHKDERVPSPSIRSPSPRKDTIDTPSPSDAEPIKNCPFTQNAATYSPCDATACKDLGSSTCKTFIREYCLHHATDNGCQYVAKLVTVPAPSPRDSTNEFTLAPSSAKGDEDKYETTPAPSSDEEDKTIRVP